MCLEVLFLHLLVFVSWSVPWLQPLFCIDKGFLSLPRPLSPSISFSYIPASCLLCVHQLLQLWCLFSVSHLPHTAPLTGPFRGWYKWGHGGVPVFCLYNLKKAFLIVFWFGNSRRCWKNQTQWISVLLMDSHELCEIRWTVTELQCVVIWEWELYFICHDIVDCQTMYLGLINMIIWICLAVAQ